MYQLTLPAKWKIHDVFHVNVLSEAIPDTIPHQWKPTPPPMKVNDEDFWVMEKLLLCEGYVLTRRLNPIDAIRVCPASRTNRYFRSVEYKTSYLP
jgi:hypothetical protein